VLTGRSGDETSWVELDALIVRAEIEVVAQDAEPNPATPSELDQLQKLRPRAPLGG
jgi:hypothetical protein